MNTKKKSWFEKLLDKAFGPEIEPYLTTDGKRPCPYDGMSDEDLYDYERDMQVPNPTWKNFQDFARSQLELGSRSEFVQGPKVVDDVQAVVADKVARNLAGKPVEQPSKRFASGGVLPRLGQRMIVELTPGEVQSGLHRIRHAELLIEALPKDHEGRNTWLMNFGMGYEAVELRRRHMPKGPTVVVPIHSTPFSASVRDSFHEGPVGPATLIDAPSHIRVLDRDLE